MATSIGPVLDAIRVILGESGLDGAVKIPLRTGLPHFELQAVLDGATYSLDLRWNVRDASWYMHVLTADGAEIITAGLRLVVAFPIGAYRTGRLPPGVFVLIDSAGAGADAGKDDLGIRHQLYYFPAGQG